MNECIFDRLNKTVKSDDILYFLGDFAFGDKSKIPELRARINCKNIFAIQGNHDDAIYKSYRYIFNSFHELKRIRECGHSFTLCHYPMQVWDGSGHGYFHVHGHCHGHLSESFGRKMDVGVDTNDFYPYSLEQVVDILSKKEIYSPDHH